MNNINLIQNSLFPKRITISIIVLHISEEDIYKKCAMRMCKICVNLPVGYCHRENDKYQELNKKIGINKSCK